MINLLPVKNKKEARREFLGRIMIVLGIGLSFLIATQLVFCFFSWFFLSSFLKSLESQKVYMEKLTQRENLEQYETSTAEFNKNLSLLKNIGFGPSVVTSGIQKILSVKPEDVDVSSFLFQESSKEGESPTLRFTGHAGTRDALVSFADSLKKITSFSDIESPLVNLLTDRDIDYVLTVTINKNNF